jgi:hypothetical protein
MVEYDSASIKMITILLGYLRSIAPLFSVDAELPLNKNYRLQMDTDRDNRIKM